jgi:hypothetical protein
MKDSSTAIYHKFINTNKGTLIISGLIIDSVTLTNCDIITISTNALSVNIESSTFGNTAKDMI